MPILKKIKENLKAVSSIETITKTYQEIANLRMNKIRRRVLDNREFIEGLSRVYVMIKKAHIAQLKKQGLRKKEETSIRRRGQKVVVFLSGNERFYGTLILDIWKGLFNYLAENKADLAVVGQIGKYLVKRGGLEIKTFYFELDDDNPEKEKIKEIIEFIKNYEEIIVLHGRFQTILSQKMVQTNISGDIAIEEGLAEVKKYLFEPSPRAVLEFFETELMSAFFNQAILEQQLSRYATKMIAMYQATENAKERKKGLEREQRKLEHQLLNRKQIELFAGSQLWA